MIFIQFYYKMDFFYSKARVTTFGYLQSNEVRRLQLMRFSTIC